MHGARAAFVRTALDPGLNDFQAAQMLADRGLQDRLTLTRSDAFAVDDAHAADIVFQTRGEETVQTLPGLIQRAAVQIQ